MGGIPLPNETSYLSFLTIIFSLLLDKIQIYFFTSVNVSRHIATDSGLLDLPFSAHEPAKRVHHVVHLPEVGLDDEERNPEGDDDDAVVSDHLAERLPGDEGDQEEGGVHQAGRQVEAEDAEDPFGRKRTTSF